MRLYVKLIDLINKLLIKVIGIVMLLMTAFVFIQVICRYIFNFTLPWTEELARYLMIWAVFLGAAVSLRQSNLIALEILVQFTPKSISKIIQIIAQVISLIFFVVLVNTGMDMLKISGFETAPVTKLPMSIVYSSLPVSMVLMILNSIAVFIEKNVLKEGVE